MIKSQEQTTHARKTQEDFFIKYFTSHLLFVSFERVVPSLRVRESWRPNITEIFWPRSYGRQRCVFHVLHGCSTGALAFLTISRLPPQFYAPVSTSSLNPTDRNSTQFVGLILPSNSHVVIWTRLHNSFRYLATGMCHFRFLWNGPVWSSSSGNNCHPVQRSLSSGASVYESIMGSFFTSSHFISQFPPTRFPLITAIRMCHFLPVHYLKWHFWPGQQVKT